MISIRTFFLPILLLAGFTSFAQIDGRTLEYDGNLITIESLGMDTLEVIDPETNEPTIVFKKTERFAKLNGNPIYQRNEAEQPIGSAAQSGFGGFIEKLLDDEIRTAKNTFHYLELVIDDKGGIAYFKTRFINEDGKPIEQSSITSDMLIKLSDAKIKPARRGGVAVPYYIRVE